MTVAFTRTTRVAGPIAAVYEASLSVDVHLESFTDHRETAVAGVTSGVMAEGDTVTWRAVHFGIPFYMTSEIVDADPPRRFTDRQVHGPFASFTHTHTLSELGPDETRMQDDVRFTAPLGPLGRIAEVLFLRRRITALIDERNAHVESLFGSP